MKSVWVFSLMLGSVMGLEGKQGATLAPVTKVYRNAGIGFSLTYPAYLVPQDAHSLKEVMAHGRHAGAAAPETDDSDQKAEQCDRVLFYATVPEAASGNSAAAQPGAAGDAHQMIFAMELDRSCVPKGTKDEEMLAELAGSAAQIPGLQVTSPKMYHEVDKHRVHVGSAAGVLDGPAPEAGKQVTHEQAIVSAASFVQHNHLVLILFQASTTEGSRALAESMIQFDGHTPTLLLPFAASDGRATP